MSFNNTPADLMHNTIVSNTLRGIYAYNGAVITLTNNIFANFNYQSIYTPTTAIISATHNLFWNNGSNPVTGTNAILASPQFLPDGYHIGPNSPAINAGQNVNVIVDYDGERRLGGKDIGADEYIWYLYLPLILKN